MMLTWFFAGLCLHYAMTNPASKIIFWGPDEDRALQPLDYAWTLWENQDDRLKDAWPLDRPRERQAYMKMELANDSVLVALPGKDPDRREILFGAYKRKWGNEKLEQMKARLRSVTIVPYDWAICQTYGELKARLQELGRSVADNDLWIAACAVRHSIPLVSNNRSDFEGIPGLVLISEVPVIAQIESQKQMFSESNGKNASGLEPPSSK